MHISSMAAHLYQICLPKGIRLDSHQPAIIASNMANSG
jgi:hypothetical protein